MPDDVTPPIDSSMDGSPQYQDAPPQQQAQQDPMSGTIPEQQSPTPPQIPTQNDPNAGSGGTFEKILQVLAGSPRKDAHYDPNTGQMVSTPVTSKTSLAGH